jgi:bacteriocin-like protein
MKEKKKEKDYEVLSQEQLKKINGGGYWLTYTNSKGELQKVWIR